MDAEGNKIDGFEALWVQGRNAKERYKARGEADKSAIQALENKYNTEGITEQEKLKAYAEIMDGASDSAREYARYLGEAGRSATDFSNQMERGASKIKGFGATVKSALSGLAKNLLNAGLWALASAAISVAIQGIDAYVNRVKYAKEAINEITKKWDESREKQESAKKTVEEYGEEYKKLASGVDTKTNRNLTLATSDYERYLEIVDAIGKSSLDVVDGYDAQGHAILNLTDTVNGLNDALDNLAQETRDKIIGNSTEVLKNLQTFLFNKPDIVSHNQWLKEWYGAANDEEAYDNLYDNIISGNDKMIAMAITLEQYGVNFREVLKKASTVTSEGKSVIDRGIFKEELRTALTSVNVYEELADSDSEIEALVAPAREIVSTIIDDVFVNNPEMFSGIGKNTKEILRQAAKNIDFSAFDITDGLKLQEKVQELFTTPFTNIDNQKSLNALDAAYESFLKDEIPYSQFMQIGDDVTKQLIANGVSIDTIALIEASYGTDDNSVYATYEKALKNRVEGLSQLFLKGLTGAQLKFFNTDAVGKEAKTEADLATAWSEHVITQADALDTLQSKWETLSTTQKNAAETISEIGENGAITAEQYEKLIGHNEKYAKAVRYDAMGRLSVDQEAIAAINAEDNEQQLIVNRRRQKEALAEYTKELEKLQKLRDGGSSDKELRAQEEIVNGLVDEYNGFSLLVDAIEKATTALSKWQEARKTADLGDNFRTAKGALEDINEGLTTGRKNTDQYRAAMDYWFSASSQATMSDSDMKKRLETFQKFYNEKGELDRSNFGNYMVKQGLMSKTGNRYDLTTTDVNELVAGSGLSLEALKDIFSGWNEYEGSTFQYLISAIDLELKKKEALTPVDGTTPETPTPLDASATALTSAAADLSAAADALGIVGSDISNHKLSPIDFIKANPNMSFAEVSDAYKAYEKVFEAIEQNDITGEIEAASESSAENDTRNSSDDGDSSVSNDKGNSEYNSNAARTALMSWFWASPAAQKYLATQFHDYDVGQAAAKISPDNGTIEDLGKGLQIPLSEALARAISENNNTVDISGIKNITETRGSEETVVVDADTTAAQEKIDELTGETEEPAVINVEENGAYAAAAVIDKAARSRTSTIKIKMEASKGTYQVGGADASQTFIGDISNLYASGTDNAEAGNALVGEVAPEIVVRKNTGEWFLANEPQLVDLANGDIVFNGRDTRRILSGNKAIGGRSFAVGRKPIAVTDNDKIIYGNFPTPYNKDIITGGGNTDNNDSSKSSGGGAPSYKDILDELSKLYDWVTIALDKAKQATQKLVKKAGDAVGYWLQNKELDKAIASTTKEIQTNQAGYEKYLAQAASSAQRLNLSSDIINKIQTGAIEITSYDEETQKKIAEYKKWYDLAQGCLDTIDELRDQEKELNRQKIDNVLTHYKNRLTEQEENASLAQARLELKNAQGREIIGSDYDKQITASKNRLNLLSEERAAMKQNFDSALASGAIQLYDDNWYKYYDELQKIDLALVEANSDLIELNDNVSNIEITNLKYARSELEQIAESLNGMISFHDAQNTDNIPDYYVNLITNGTKEIANLEAQNRLLVWKSQGMDKLSEKYQEIQNEINENNNSILGIKTSQEEWNDAVADLQINKLQDYRTELEKTNDVYQRQRDIQQAIEDLEKARTQRNKLVYVEGEGFQYRADPEAVRKAQDALDDLMFQEKIKKIDDAIDDINKQKETNNVWDYNAENMVKEFDVSKGAELYSSMLGFDNKLSEIAEAFVNPIKSSLAAMTPTSDSLQFSFGDINLTGVQDSSTLAEQIVNRLPGQIMQQMYRN